MMKFDFLSKDKSLIFLILANLVPVLGVLFMDWSVFYVLIYYWLESAVVGIFNVVKIVMDTRSFLFRRIFFALFFIVHFGGFMAGHLLFLFILNGFFTGSSTFSFSDIFSVISNVLVYAAALFTSHGISFFTNYIGKKEYKKIELGSLMFAPYSRIVLMHLTILFGMFAAVLTGMNIAVVILFVVFKIFVDLRAHRKEHDKISGEPSDDLGFGLKNLNRFKMVHKKLFDKIVSK